MSSDSKIKDGLSLPIWMKTKENNDFETFAASPPSPDDAFSFIRYKNSDTFAQGNVDTNGHKDQGSSLVTEEKSQYTNVVRGFKTMDIAESSKTISAGKTVNIEDQTTGNSITKAVKKLAEQGSLIAHSLVGPAGQRRGSKSLPATPSPSPPPSPRPARKHRVMANRYFTPPFEPIEDTKNSCWLTTILLGYRKDLGSSSSTLAEEDEGPRNGLSMTESVENLGPGGQGQQNSSSEPKKKKSLRPLPSELREMNFWSPTSM